MSSCYLQTPMTDFLEQGDPWDGVEIPLDIKDEAVDEDFPPSSALEVIKTDDEVVEDEVVEVEEETPSVGDDDVLRLRVRGFLMSRTPLPKKAAPPMCRLFPRIAHPVGRTPRAPLEPPPGMAVPVPLTPSPPPTAATWKTEGQPLGHHERQAEPRARHHAEKRRLLYRRLLDEFLLRC